MRETSGPVRGWPVVSLDDVAELSSGNTPSRRNNAYFSTGTGTPWVKTGDLTNGMVYRTSECVSQLAIRDRSIRVHPPGTVLVAMYGGFAQIGRTGILAIEAATNQAITAIRCDERRLLPGFLLATLNSRVHEWRRVAGSSRKDANITQDDVRRFRIALPPIETQRAVAALNERFETANRLSTELVSTKERFRRELMVELLTEKRRFPRFARPWREAQIGELFHEAVRPIEWDESATYELLSVRRRSGGVFVRGRTTASRIKTKLLFEAHEDDILISKMQAVHGAIGIVRRDQHGMKVSGSYVILRPRPGSSISSKYFFWLTQLREMYRAVLLSSYGVHIEKMTFNLEWYQRTRIRIPADVEEQDQIVAVLEALNDEELKLAQLGEALDRQKQNILEALLSGEIRLAAQ